MRAALLGLLALFALVLWLAHLRKGTGTGSPSPQAVQTEEPSRPGPAPGQGASLARAELPADAMPDGAGGVGVGDPVPSGPPTVELNARQRVNRHRWVKLYLTSPARGTEPFAQIEALCREYGYGPWAVGPVYSLAREMVVFDRLRDAGFGAGEGAEGVQAVLGQIQASTFNRVVGTFGDLGVEWHPDFLAAVRQIQPAVFFGNPSEAIPPPDEEMLDGLSWEAAEAKAKP